eukprot:6461808-Prymnesium_polylepis.1
MEPSPTRSLAPQGGRGWGMPTRGGLRGGEGGCESAGSPCRSEGEGAVTPQEARFLRLGRQTP